MRMNQLKGKTTFNLPVPYTFPSHISPTWNGSKPPTPMRAHLSHHTWMTLFVSQILTDPSSEHVMTVYRSLGCHWPPHNPLT